LNKIKFIFILKFYKEGKSLKVFGKLYEIPKSAFYPDKHPFIE